MGRNNLFAGAAMVIFLLSLAGIPPLAGFVGKFLLFGTSIDTGFSWLAVIAILNSVLSLAVYLRILVPMYRSNNQNETKRITNPIPEKPIVQLKTTSVRVFLLESVWVITLVLTLSIGLGAQLMIENL